MIYTITFNPALDYIVKLGRFTEGIVNRTKQEKLLPGGKGINVSTVLGSLGAANTALGFVAGFSGKEILRILTKKGVTTDFIELNGGFSRINIKLKAQKETEINATGPEIDKTALSGLYKKLDNLTSGDYLVLAGSIPKGVPDDIYSEIMEYLSAKNVNIIVDAEKDLLKKTLSHKPFLIKPNHHELGAIFEKELTTKEEIVECAKNLIDSGARNVLVSMAGEGAILAAENGNVMHCKAPTGKVINSTGAGDSMVAGFLAKYSQTGDYEKALISGICAGSASAFSEELATREDVEKLYEQINKAEYIK